MHHFAFRIANILFPFKWNKVVKGCLFERDVLQKKYGIYILSGKTCAIDHISTIQMQFRDRPLRKLFNLPWGLFSCKIASKSFLSIFFIASSRVFTVISGQVLPKYSNNWFVGLCVERLSNSLNVFLGTPSFNAKLLQFAKAIDCTSSFKAISSKRLTLGESATECRDVIASLTNSESPRAAAEKG